MTRRAWWLLAVLPMIALACYPPTGFDETLYHLPLVRAIAEEGLGFHEQLRFPVFPLLAELLAVPAYVAGGDVATHAIPLIATLLTALVLYRWRGALPAAAFLGAPIVVHLATSLYVEAVLTLFVCAGFYFVNRVTTPHPPSAPSPLTRGEGKNLKWREKWPSPLRRGEGYKLKWPPPVTRGEGYTTDGNLKWPSPLRRGEKVPKADEGSSSLPAFAAGLLLGAACATKYLGLYFAGAAALMLFLRARPSLVRYVAGVLITALPMYAWIYAQTGNPLFPYFGHSPWVAAFPPTQSIASLMRIPFDVVFARDRMGLQPPFTPFFAIALIVIAWKSRARFLLPLGYLIAFLFLPADARYLVPLLPLVLIEAATLMDTLPRWLYVTLVIAALAPGPAYAIYRIHKQGSPFDRTAYLRRAVPEYRALERAGTSRVYACRGEQLKWHARGPFLGDHFGPHSFSRVLNERMHANLTARRIEHLLVTRDCITPPPPRGFTLVYQDDAAQLWRVD